MAGHRRFAIREENHFVSAMDEAAHEEIDHALDAAVVQWGDGEFGIDCDGDVHGELSSRCSPQQRMAASC